MPKHPRKKSDLPLFLWAKAQDHASRPVPKLILLSGAPTPDGDPRPALVIPGRRFPVVFASMADALAAQRAFRGAA